MPPNNNFTILIVKNIDIAGTLVHNKQKSNSGETPTTKAAAIHPKAMHELGVIVKLKKIGKDYLIYETFSWGTAFDPSSVNLGKL